MRTSSKGRNRAVSAGRRTAVGAVVLVALGTLGWGCSRVRCGEGTHREGNVCERTPVIESDQHRADAGVDARDATSSSDTSADTVDGGGTDDSGPTDTGGIVRDPSDRGPEAPDAVVTDVTERRDVDRSVQTGTECDPNEFEPFCREGNAVTCESGTVTAKDACLEEDERCVMTCFRDEEACHPMDRSADCVDQNVTNTPCPDDFEPRCDQGTSVRCDGTTDRIVREDCRAKDQECRTHDGRSLCADPDTEFCEYTDFRGECVGDDRITHCDTGTLPHRVEERECPGERTCRTATAGDSTFGVCAEPDAELCDPESFESYCDGDTLVGCNGVLYRRDCSGYKECVLIDRRDGEGEKAVCAETRFGRCDPNYYRDWCDGNKKVTCSRNGFIKKEECTGLDDETCERDSFGAVMCR